MEADSPFYVRREADEKLARLMYQSGVTIRVKGPRQVGKSSLMTNVRLRANSQASIPFTLDFQRSLIKSQISSLDDMLFSLAYRIHLHFKTDLEPGKQWDVLLGAKDNLTYFIEKALLVSVDKPVWFLFDEVDWLFDLPFRDDFFATLRGWHNLRAEKNCWKKLNLILAHSTEPRLWIENLNESPFNVGEELVLLDFTLAQLGTLNMLHGFPLSSDTELEQLFALTSGHPYLTRQAFYMLAAEKWPLERLERESISPNGPFDRHLRHLLNLLQSDAALRHAVKCIEQIGNYESELVFQRLNAAGIVRGEMRDNVRIRCGLYSNYFRRYL